VGEGFDCIIGINNELPSTSDKRITTVKLAAEMQTPSHTRALDLNPPNEEVVRTGLAPATSFQSVIHFDLREEGSHTLSVSVTYNEGVISKSETTGAIAASGGRVRSFRKLYNFNVGPCLSVRTKATDLHPRAGEEQGALDRFALECQLENLADDTITMEKLVFEPRVPFTSKSINWDEEHVAVPTLAPREVTQVAFIIEEVLGEKGRVKKELTKDSRIVLGVLTIHWRSAMGHLGVLSTGWLTSRKR
jgi:trafficking protein particle complex subunit 13